MGPSVNSQENSENVVSVVFETSKFGNSTEAMATVAFRVVSFVYDDGFNGDCENIVAFVTVTSALDDLFVVIVEFCVVASASYDGFNGFN